MAKWESSPDRITPPGKFIGQWAITFSPPGYESLEWKVEILGRDWDHDPDPPFVRGAPIDLSHDRVALVDGIVVAVLTGPRRASQTRDYWEWDARNVFTGEAARCRCKIQTSIGLLFVAWFLEQEATSNPLPEDVLRLAKAARMRYDIETALPVVA
jgi:hypothetical protein